MFYYCTLNYMPTLSQGHWFDTKPNRVNLGDICSYKAALSIYAYTLLSLNSCFGVDLISGFWKTLLLDSN